MLYIRRREFITLVGGAAAAWPLAARAQQSAMPVIGLVRITTPEDSAHLVAAFKRGLGESGFVEGQNVTIEYRYALNQVDRLPALMAELVDRGVAVLAATGGTISARAAKAATTTVPIVFRGRSGESGARCQPQSAKRQCHWRERIRRPVGLQKDWPAT
jgi:putative ABC transport system substrate-binding protein